MKLKVEQNKNVVEPFNLLTLFLNSCQDGKKKINQVKNYDIKNSLETIIS